MRGVFVVGLAAEYILVPLACCTQAPTHPAPRLSAGFARWRISLVRRSAWRKHWLGKREGGPCPAGLLPTAPGQQEGLTSLGSRDRGKLLMSWGGKRACRGLGLLGLVSQRIVLLKWGKEMNGAGGCCVFLESSRPDRPCPTSPRLRARPPCPLRVRASPDRALIPCWERDRPRGALGEALAAPRVRLAGTQGLWGHGGSRCSNTGFREEGLLRDTLRDGQI